MNRMLFSVIAAVFIFMTLLFSCNGGGSSGVIPATGTVSLYLTDDISLYSQVTATINRVELVHTGMGMTCNLLTEPVTVNIANLAGVMQLVNVTDCVPGPYNRFRIQFDKNVQLMSGATGTISNCSFVSYKDENQGSQPNILHCDPGTNICSLDVNGAVNVLALQDNAQVLDFDLKNFEVSDLATPGCAVTLKVSPMTPRHLQQLGYREAVTGLVSGLDIMNRTFDLTRGNMTFHVQYAGIADTDQPGLNTLLTRAQEDRLKTRVITVGIDLEDNTIAASAIAVKIEGTLSDLVTDETFTVNYGQNGSRNITVDYSNADVAGIVVNGAWVDVKLFGHQPENDVFLANKVEVEMQGMMTED